MAQTNKKSSRVNVVGMDKGMGPLEAQVLRAISDLSPPVTVRAVCDTLQKEGYFAYQGVLNCMNRLVRKGVLRRTEGQGAFLYAPLVDLEQLAAQIVSNVLGKTGGRVDRVICHLLEIDPEVGVAQIAELRRKVHSMTRSTKR